VTGLAVDIVILSLLFGLAVIDATGVMLNEAPSQEGRLEAIGPFGISTTLEDDLQRDLPDPWVESWVRAPKVPFPVLNFAKLPAATLSSKLTRLKILKYSRGVGA